jgi:hypothetical protein
VKLILYLLLFIPYGLLCWLALACSLFTDDGWYFGRVAERWMDWCQEL